MMVPVNEVGKDGKPRVKEWRRNPATLTARYLDMFGLSPKSRLCDPLCAVPVTLAQLIRRYAP
jgi:hypothetical protein